MKDLEAVELRFFHPNTGTRAVITVRQAALNSPTVRVNVSLHSEVGIERWIGDRMISTWHRWFDKLRKSDTDRPLPVGWYPG